MEHRKVLKGIGSVFLSPQRRNNTWAAVWTWGVLSESSHVCPPDWLSCIWGGFKTLFLITFKCSVFSELPLCNKGPCRALMIGVNSTQRKLLVKKKARNLSRQPHHYDHAYSSSLKTLVLLLPHNYIHICMDPTLWTKHVCSNTEQNYICFKSGLGIHNV